ncbi:hypothetical protein KP509_22G051600 [Ceratopteris richardii]|uniref:RING-type E3 ubiquitin transferase n=1 Tax=Ceratopteris richardii TaxID=49495 RepID=A0A8T2S535_CERRI|nr:hypothetical protein KP509_22G051600 [Ceratopteris richardii]
MPQYQRVKASHFSTKSNNNKASKQLSYDEEIGASGYGIHQPISRLSSSRIGSSNLSNASGSSSQQNHVSSTSSSSALKSTAGDVFIGGGIGFDREDADSHGAGNYEIVEVPRWVKNSSSSSSSGEILRSQKDERLGVKAGTLGQRGHGLQPLHWRDRYLSQPERLHSSVSRQVVADDCHQRTSPSHLNERSYRKGSSSKAPQTNDLTAPLFSDMKLRSSMANVTTMQNEGSTLVKNNNASITSRAIQSSSYGVPHFNRKKSAFQTYSGHLSRVEESALGRRDITMRGLGNFVCSSAADVLPSLSSSALSNLACTSTSDVLPSNPNSVTGTSGSYSRSNSRAYGTAEVQDTTRRMDPVKQKADENTMSDTREVNERSNGEAVNEIYGASSGASLCTRSSYNHESGSEPLRAEFVTYEASASSSSASSLPSNYRQCGRNVGSRGRDNMRSLYRSNGSFFDTNPYRGEMSNHWSARRRSLYGSRVEPASGEARSSGRSLSRTRSSSSNWSARRELYNTQSDFLHSSEHQTLMHPAPATFVQPYVSESSSTSSAAGAETSSFNTSTGSNGIRPRLTVEGLSEILAALEYIERDDDLSYEQILMLEATILLGGIGLHDRYRDMRIDIDSMSYEELLALEERIGNVNTGLSEESIKKCLRSEAYTSPDITNGYVPQEIEIKCSICQEEFDAAAELGVLECGHSYHIACIKQWLIQKNQCPICKAPALS